MSLGSSRMRGSLGSVSSAELGSPSVETASAESSPMHRSVALDKTVGGDEAGSSTSREELTLDEKRKSEDDLASASKEKRKDSGRGMGVRLLSSIFGKNPSPSPTSEASPPSPAPTKSPVAKTRLGSTSESEPRKESPASEQSTPEEPSASKRTAVPTKLGIGVGGNVLAEMKARQERRISGILKQNSNEDSDISERSEAKTEPTNKANSMSPNPLGGIRLRPTPPTPEEPEPPKLPEKTGIRFNQRSAPQDDSESKTHPLAGIRLRPRGGSEEAEVSSTKSEEKSNNVVNQFRLRAASSAAEEASSHSSADPASEVKANPLSGVKLRSTGINVTDPLKSPNIDPGNVGDNKNEARNSLTKLKPPPLAPKPRPWSIVGSDKKPGTLPK